jgi:tetratricopeptide (TPR) repeat protein
MLPLLVWIATVARLTYAQETADTKRAVARAFGQEGVDAYKRGDYEQAAQKLARAYAIWRAPTLALWCARTLRQQSKLIEAAEKYQEALRLEATAGKVEVQRRAQEHAAKERQELLPQIPSMIFVIQGASLQDVELEVDGQAVPKSARNRPWQVNPGKHLTKLRLRDNSVTAVVELAPGEQRTVRLRLNPDSVLSIPPRASIASPGLAAGSSHRTRASPNRQGQAPSVWTAAGWVSLAVGAAGAAFAGVDAILAANKLRTLNERCPNGVCPPSEQETLKDYRSLRTLSKLGMVAGTVGIATGGWLLLMIPPAKLTHSPAKLRASFWFDLEQAGLRGAF